MDAANALGYTPDFSASMLKSQSNHTVAFLDPDPQNPFYINMIAQISDILRDQYGYRSIMIPNTQYGSHILDSFQLFLSLRVECIVFSPVAPGSTLRYDRQLENLIQAEQRCKFLQLHSHLFPSISSLYYNDILGMEMVTRYLLENGHRRILVVSDDRERMPGCMAAYESFGIKEPEIPLTPLSPSISSEDVIALIKKYHPTAILSVVDMFSLPTLGAISKLGLRIPQDISFVAYDDSTWPKALGISIIGYSDEVVSQKAVELIMGMISGKISEPEEIKLVPRIVHRGSIRSIES